ncbi:hypothetical protein GCM10007425_01380 [Lysinibacillus alkalisoli]|uniref:Carboxymuconolactone decarboxylase-like domain-containing protein n=1 Tax=Lysinibacillus alkalisoli TaxID=1911548 RepID=A0A917D5A7_9BACI|nr:carboxymuconolactone decarboxylase family protein [Lysinibacillus alkalisoli]GGG10831.1 hypothetical protein GCM10007425_01380 [Lysinibacillus alkalisoli]
MYNKTDISKLAQLNDLAKKPNQAFHSWNAAVFKEGALTTKLKETIAIASATVTGCPYCIEIHTEAAKKAGVTKEEAVEAIFVATALKAGSAFAHGANSLRAYDEATGEGLYEKSYFAETGALQKLAPEAFKTFIQFSNEAVAEGVLTIKEKEIIAVAIAHITGCPYCIELHVANAKAQNVTKEELAETIFVASALKAGSAFAHSINVLNAY